MDPIIFSFVSIVVSILSLVVSIISIILSSLHDKRNFNVQLYDYRLNQYFIIESIRSTIREHIFLLEKTDNLSFIKDSNFLFEVFTNNYACAKVYTSSKEDNYTKYTSQTYLELLQIQRNAGAITFVFRDDKYSKAAKKLVMAYIELLKAFYEHHVYTTKFISSRKDIPIIKSNTEPNDTEQEINILEADLKDRGIPELIETLLQRYREFEEIPVLSALEEQITLCKP